MDGKKHTSIASLNSEVPMITFGGLSKNYMVRDLESDGE